MSYTLITPPASEPVTVLEAKEFCRLDGDEFDPLVSGLVMAARTLVEVQANRTLMPTTLRLSMDRFPGGPRSLHELMSGRFWDGALCTDGALDRPRRANIERQIRLPLPPLASITSFSYVDENGATQTLASNQYLLDTDSEPGRLTPLYGQDWPATRQQANAVQITYVAGYATAALVPEPLKLAIKMLVNYWFANPNAAGGKIEEQPMAVRTLVGSCAMPQVW